MTAVDILNKAAEAVGGDRAETHGNMYTTMNEVAQHWSIHLGVSVSAEQVCDCMELMKIVRAKNGIKDTDHYIDRAGYAAMAGALAQHDAGALADQ